jgi:hypothetical protein
VEWCFTASIGQPRMSNGCRAATTPVPQPLATPGAVTNNVMTRTLVVSRPDTLGGYERHSWRRAHEEFAKAERAGHCARQ